MNPTDTIHWPANLVAVDAETTGLDPQHCGLLEFSALHLASGRQRVWEIEPSRCCMWDAAALRVNGLTQRTFANTTRMDTLEFLHRFTAWLHEVGAVPALLVGRNVGFDRAFLGAAAERLESAERAFFESAVHYVVLDTHAAVLAIALARGWSVSERMEWLYAQLGVSPEAKPHLAERGAQHVAAGLEAIVRAVRAGEPMVCRGCNRGMDRPVLCPRCAEALAEGAGV